MKTQHNDILRVAYLWKVICLLIIIFLCSATSGSFAQCPPNIDFEKGDFTGWKCFTGEVLAQSGINQVIFTEVAQGKSFPNRQTMLSTIPGNGIDPYGLFPKNCPNGSGHSIMLGNDGNGHQAEGLSYSFTIPSGRNDFSIYFQYALVLQNPGHSYIEQPRFTVGVYNVTDGNSRIACSLDPFVPDGGLPGFFSSTVISQNGITLCKDWAAASINLDGYAGKQIEIVFTTSDCTFQQHFGYAYLDIESDCSSKISGATFCPNDPFVDLTAPPGFQFYRWFNRVNSSLGTQQTLRLSPLPVAGDSVFVELIPYNGYGCIDTLFAYLSDTLTIIANAGPDKQFCTNDTLQLGEAPKQGLFYKWFPETGLSNPNIANPFVTPTKNTQYTLTATSAGGGCKSTDVVKLIKKCDVIEFYVPNAFNPNSVSGNNTLRPYLYGYSKVNYFRVYNRYGQLLYSMSSDLPGWDGTIKGKPATTQTVVWVIEAVDAYGRVEKRQGTSILLR